jgi:hypothetical protein
LQTPLHRRPGDEGVQHAAHLPTDALRYLPLTSSTTKDWVALLDGGLNRVGWAPVDGF